MYAVIGFLGALGSRCAFLLMPIRLDPRDLVFLPGTSKENSGKALENSRTCEEIIAHSLHFSEELRASLENRVNLKNPQELIMKISWEFPRKRTSGLPGLDILYCLYLAIIENFLILFKNLLSKLKSCENSSQIIVFMYANNKIISKNSHLIKNSLKKP